MAFKMKKLLFILLLLCLTAYGSVEFLNNSNFNNKISKGIVVVEYWADWNKGNQFEGLENTMEDLTVNQQQAQFEAQQFQQSQANIMDSMRGAAGSSGVAALAQTLASQGQLAAQRSSASIGQQEAANQMAAARQAGQLQQMEARGAADVDLQQRQGQAAVQQAESGRISTLLGMEYGELQAAQAGVQAAYQNQQSAIAMDMERRGQNMAMQG